MAAHPKIIPAETILFAGAGLSMNLGLPSWYGLIGDLGTELGFDPDLFRGFGNYLALAEYYEIEKGTLAPLAKALSLGWHSKKIDVGNSAIHRLIVEMDFAKIYTTNFDHWIEKAFEHAGRPYRKIVTVADIPGSKPSVTDIVKFHGDLGSPASLILTESHYFDRLEFETPLDLLFRADALSRPILFIGYSLADMNIRYLFHKLWKLWDKAAAGASRQRSYIFMLRPNPVEQKIFEKWGIAPIVDPAGDGNGLAKFLDSLKANRS